MYDDQLVPCQKLFFSSFPSVSVSFLLASRLPEQEKKSSTGMRGYGLGGKEMLFNTQNLIFTFVFKIMVSERRIRECKVNKDWTRVHLFKFWVDRSDLDMHFEIRVLTTSHTRTSYKKLL